MPSSDFQKIVRDMGGISEKIEIKSVSNELIFKCVGNLHHQRQDAETEGAMKFIEQEDTHGVIQESSSKKFKLFYKVHEFV